MTNHTNGSSLRTSIAIPVKMQKETIGVLEFGSSKLLELYPDLLNILGAIGSQVAQYLKRAEAAADNAKLYKEAQDAIYARDELFAIASHELKTPLTSLKLTLQLTLRQIHLNSGVPLPNEKLFKNIATSTKQVNQIANLVDNMLDVTKIRKDKLEIERAEINLSELIREVSERYSEAAKKADCAIELDIEENVTGQWDQSRIEQVIVNLLSNAIKYAPGKPIKIELTKKNSDARLVVRDQGPGISQAEQSKIFDRFERLSSSRNVKGLGLGLFIVKYIVEAHLGKIHIESHDGLGCAMIVELPCRSQPDIIQTDLKSDDDYASITKEDCSA